MAYHETAVYQWTDDVARNLPGLSPSQATVVAVWSRGMVLARSCGLTAVAAILARWQHRKENTVRQQVRACCSEAAATAGTHRAWL